MIKKCKLVINENVIRHKQEYDDRIQNSERLR